MPFSSLVFAFSIFTDRGQDSPLATWLFRVEEFDREFDGDNGKGAIAASSSMTEEGLRWPVDDHDGRRRDCDVGDAMTIVSSESPASFCSFVCL